MKRVVVKIGSSTLTDVSGRIDHAFIETLAAEVSHLMAAEDVQPIIVSSGSIAAGLDLLDYGAERPDDMPTLQAAAATGQVGLINAYADAFRHNGHFVGQVLLTRATTDNRESYLHARDTIERLIELGCVPVINENDTVAVDEIRFGDNDTLAAMVAAAINADLCILLSDIDGFYTADPRKDEGAELLERVDDLTAQVEASAGGVGSRSGSGGMLTKVKAARALMAAGIPMVICEGHRPHAITDAVCGRSVGTTFVNESGLGVHGRKAWIALGAQVRGRVVCDDGAIHALRERGSSLLPVGITQLEGDFSKGDPIDVIDEQGRLLGRGLARYDTAQLTQVMGKRGAEEFIHRDELVLF